MTRSELQALQRAINVFTRRRLSGVAPLKVDGKLGHATLSRVKWVKYYLGYQGGAGVQNATVDKAFRSRVWHPNSARYSTPARIARGMKRRSVQRAKWRKNHKASKKATGVGRYDGVPVANWLIPYLQWARANGWRGRLVSGWRDPAYSESLCYRICGAPRCPGRCAGRSSNHAGSAEPNGAVDVSDYVTFGRVIARCPIRPAIINTLGARDPVHFSVSGQ
ncbi:MAG: hypothetical protein WKF48_05835 [Solirubrobacteraceae bacterium]